MKIIKLDEKNIYADQLYDALDKILYFGNEHLPFIFLKKVYMSDGHMLQLPRWITKKHMDSIDAHVQELMNNINWEDNSKENN